jgi:hypothetical protein
MPALQAQRFRQRILRYELGSFCLGLLSNIQSVSSRRHSSLFATLRRTVTCCQAPAAFKATAALRGIHSVSHVASPVKLCRSNGILSTREAAHTKETKMTTNETKTETKQINTVTQLDTAFGSLIKQREVWEAGAYAASNTELYALLGHCLDVMYKLKRFTELARGLNGLLEKRGFKFTAGTSIEVKLLRAVFGDPSDANKYKNRIYSYARVLVVAHGEDVKGDGIADFITEKGGIDEIRRHDSNAEKKTDEIKLQKEHADLTLNSSDFTAIATGIPVTEDLEPADDQHFSIALVRKEADGTGSIVFGTNSVSLVSAVLGIAGRKIDAEEQEERSRQKARELQQQKQVDYDAIASELYPNNSSATVVAVTLPAPAAEAAETSA